MNEGDCSLALSGIICRGALFSVRVVVWWWVFARALFSVRVVVCVDPAVSSGRLSTLELVVCGGLSVGVLGLGDDIRLWVWQIGPDFPDQRRPRSSPKGPGPPCTDGCRGLLSILP